MHQYAQIGTVDSRVTIDTKSAGRVAREFPDCPFEGVDGVGFVVGVEVGLVYPLDSIGPALLQLVEVDARFLRELVDDELHVDVVDALDVEVEGVDPLVLVVVLVEQVEDRSDPGLFVVDALLDQILLGEGLVPRRYYLVNKTAPVPFPLPLPYLEQVVGLVEVVQLLLLDPTQLDHPPHQLLLPQLQVSVQLQQLSVPRTDKLLQRYPLAPRLDVLLVEEEDDQLALYLESEVLHLGVVDLVQAVQVVVVVDGVEGVHELVQTAIQQVDLEGSQDVEVRPGVQVETYLQLLLVYYPLLVEVVHQSVEYLQLLHLQVQETIDDCAFADQVVPALHLPQVLSE
jgi:hypothetical protein